MGTYFDINGTAMIYINTNPSIRNAKTIYLRTLLFTL